MGDYIAKKIILTLFTVMSLLLAWTFFGPTEYHYTKYHDVHIISEKKEMVRNIRCDNKEHEHHMIQQIIVEWKGINNKGETKQFTSTFCNEDDSDSGVCYKDIKKGVVSIHNCFKSIFVWVGFAITALLSLCCLEDNYYSYEDTIKINKLKIKFWKKIAQFLEYDSNTIDKVLKHYETEGFGVYKLVKYKELFSKYKSIKNDN